MKDTLPGEKATPAVAFCFFVNRLLAAEPWARERLARFAGETIEFSPLPLPPLRVTILDDGRIGPGSEAPDLTLQAGPGALLALARGEEEFLRAVEVSGNARLAQEVASLARHLRWSMLRFRLRPTAAALEPLTSPLALLPLAWLALGPWAPVWAALVIVLRDAGGWWLLRGPERLWLPLLLGVPRDLFALAIWAIAPLKHHVSWRGRRFRLGAGTLLYSEPGR